MKERPILFNTEMVRAILDGRKTQTRRVVVGAMSSHDLLYFDAKNGVAEIGVKADDGSLVHGGKYKCPCGQKGDRLWVRETHYRWTGCGQPPSNFVRDRCYADNREYECLQRGCCLVTVPSIHMPRWASRITLEITDVRVERVQEITYGGMKAEGCIPKNICGGYTRVLCKEFWIPLWDSVNTKREYSWESNPWVWVIEFKRV